MWSNVAAILDFMGSERNYKKSNYITDMINDMVSINAQVIIFVPYIMFDRYTLYSTVLQVRII